MTTTTLFLGNTHLLARALSFLNAFELFGGHTEQTCHAFNSALRYGGAFPPNLAVGSVELVDRRRVDGLPADQFGALLRVVALWTRGSVRRLALRHCDQLTDPFAQCLASRVLLTVDLSGCCNLANLASSHLIRDCPALRTFKARGCRNLTRHGVHAALKEGADYHGNAALRELDLRGCFQATQEACTDFSLPPAMRGEYYHSFLRGETQGGRSLWDGKVQGVLCGCDFLPQLCPALVALALGWDSEFTREDSSGFSKPRCVRAFACVCLRALAIVRLRTVLQPPSCRPPAARSRSRSCTAAAALTDGPLATGARARARAPPPPAAPSPPATPPPTPRAASQ
jgi:hypothetical protein